MELTEGTAELLEAAKASYSGRSHEDMFGELHEMALLEELNARQERHDVSRTARSLVRASLAMPKGIVLECLEAFGWREGHDEAGSALFFGEDGTDGFMEVGSEASGAGLAVLGGFVFNAPDGRSRYVLKCSIFVDLDCPSLPAAEDEPAGEPLGEPRRGWLRRKCAALASRVENLLSAGSAGGGEARWHMEKAGSYVVEPTFFYEDIGLSDLCSEGLRESYPIPDAEDRVDPNDGTVDFGRDAEGAIAFAGRLEEALWDRGVPASPRSC